MATLTIRQLDDAAYERLKMRAKANKRSLEAEARLALEQQSRDPIRAVATLRTFHEQQVAKYGYGSEDAVELVRKIRDEE